MNFTPKCLILFLFLTGCSGMKKSEEGRIRKNNEVQEKIYRKNGEKVFSLPEPVRKTPHYPWEERFIGDIPKIAKEYFRCKGSFCNPKRVITLPSGQKEEILDCGGMEKHGLPFREGKEFIYPILIDILNYLQEKTGQRVVITCGFRCPKHNEYADTTKASQTSKHQIGAEVDFYVETMEEKPFEVVKWIMDFYEQEGNQEFTPFMRCQKNPENLLHPGWYNKEILVRVHQKQEGRDFDNRHPYPYITIEVRYDRYEQAAVEYNWKSAQNSYLRY